MELDDSHPINLDFQKGESDGWVPDRHGQQNRPGVLVFSSNSPLYLHLKISQQKLLTVTDHQLYFVFPRIKVPTPPSPAYHI